MSSRATPPRGRDPLLDLLASRAETPQQESVARICARMARGDDPLAIALEELDDDSLDGDEQ